MTTIVSPDSDQHFGSILSPVLEFTKANGQIEQPTAVQLWLADWRARYVDAMRELKQRLAARYVHLWMGDLTEGAKHKSGQRISENEGDHVALAIRFVQPVAEMADLMVGIRGTEAHVGVGSSLEEAAFTPFADKMYREGLPASQLTHYRVFLDVEGVKFDCEHHVGGAMRPWTKGGNIQRRAISAMYEMVERNAAIANYVFRGHTHIAHETGDNEPQPRGVICRTWKIDGDAFAHRIASEFIPKLGAQYVICDRGKHEFHWFKVQIEPKQVWRPLWLDQKPSRQPGRQPSRQPSPQNEQPNQERQKKGKQPSQRRQRRQRHQRSQRSQPAPSKRKMT